MKARTIPELSALNFFPEALDYLSLKNAASKCEGCELYKNATQTVFGEGRSGSKIMFVGEQPGDEEDLNGHPFVGPAGRLFNEALSEAGIDRSIAYVTNTVKHFKWKPQGKRRLHQRPNDHEVEACLPWLAAEIDGLKPKILILLGATAAQALLGKDFRVTKEHGKWIDSPFAEHLMATVHPSSILRALDRDERKVQYVEFVEDLRKIADKLKVI